MSGNFTDYVSDANYHINVLLSKNPPESWLATEKEIKDLPGLKIYPGSTFSNPEKEFLLSLTTINGGACLIFSAENQSLYNKLLAEYPEYEPCLRYSDQYNHIMCLSAADIIIFSRGKKLRTPNFITTLHFPIWEEENTFDFSDSFTQTKKAENLRKIFNIDNKISGYELFSKIWNQDNNSIDILYHGRGTRMDYVKTCIELLASVPSFKKKLSEMQNRIEEYQKEQNVKLMNKNYSDSFLQSIQEELIRTKKAEKGTDETCPVCGCKEHRFVFPFITDPYHTKHTKLEANSDISACEICGTLFQTPAMKFTNMSFEESGKIYYDRTTGTDNSEFRNGVIYHSRYGQEPHYNTLRKLILSDFPEKREWLDVGSSGSPTAFEDINFTTIEPDPRVVEIGRELYNKDRIHCSTIEYFRSETEFDGIVFNHSLYCIPEPAAALQKAHELLNDDGILVIAISDYFMGTPSGFINNDYERIEDILRGETMRVYYNPHSLSYLAALHGFRLHKDIILEHDRISAYSKGLCSRLFIFSKAPKTAKQELLKLSNEYMKKKFEDIFDYFNQKTVETLQGLNSVSTWLVGDENILQDIARTYDTGSIQKGSNVTGNIFNIIVASFSDTKSNISQLLQSFVPPVSTKILIPCRTSTINRFHGTVDGKMQPIKSLVLKELSPEQFELFFPFDDNSNENIRKYYAIHEHPEILEGSKIIILGSARAAEEVIRFAHLLNAEILCMTDDFNSCVNEETGKPIVSWDTMLSKYLSSADMVVMGKHQNGFTERLDGIKYHRLSHRY